MKYAFGLALSVMLFCAVPCKAQTALYHSAKELEKKGFFGSTTYVVLVGDTAFDNPVRKAVSDGWGITKNVVLVEPGQLPGDFSDPNNSFLSFSTVIGALGSNLVLWQGDKFWKGYDMAKNEPVFNPPVARFTVLATYFPGPGSSNYWNRVGWRLPMVLHSFRQIITRARETGLKVGLMPVLTSEIFEKEAVRLKRKTLLLADDRFSADDVELFKQNYPFPFEVVPFPTVFSAMATRDERYAIASVDIVQGLVELFVNDAASYDLVFSNMATMTNSLKASNVKALAKAVERK